VCLCLVEVILVRNIEGWLSFFLGGGCLVERGSVSLAIGKDVWERMLREIAISSDADD
jgi:hypothetical protein